MKVTQMLRQTLTAASFCLFGTPLFALCDGPSYFERLTPAETDEVNAYAATLPYGQGTQWTLTRGDDTLILVGTIHVFDPRLDALMTDLQDVIQTADLILLEATPVEEAQLQAAIQSDPAAIFISHGATLPERLPEEIWARLSQAAAKRGVPAPLTAKMKPWYLGILLAMPPCVLTQTAAGKRGLDHLIMQSAQTAQIPMQALEPYDTLFKILQDGSADEQLDVLKLAITEEDAQIAMFTAMRDSYFSQNIGALMGLSQIAARHTPGLDPQTAANLTAESEVAILADRNIAWMPVITQATRSHDKIVIAVGAAHLPGDLGLLNLLASQGWTLTRR